MIYATMEGIISMQLYQNFVAFSMYCIAIFYPHLVYITIVESDIMHPFTGNHTEYEEIKLLPLT